MGRPNKLTDNQGTPVDWAKDVVYNTAGQITSMKYTGDGGGSNHIAETREYNVLGQMTRQRAQRNYGVWQTVMDRTYTFPSTANDGRITQVADAVSGETVQYQYDSLKRLISAATTGSQWGQSFSYDGFGNLLSQTVTKGSAPTLSVNVNGSTNRITTSGYSYDNNGNLTAMPYLSTSYDVENRLSQATHSLNGAEHYSYSPANLRVWKLKPPPCQGCVDEEVYFYGADGEFLGTYGGGSGGTFGGDPWDVNVYFAGKQIWSEGVGSPVILDRLGSTASWAGQAARYFPYGQEATSLGQNFATYPRESTTDLRYARNRYYSSTLARFTSPDPAEPGDPTNPQSFNYYAYVQDDPVNFNDPEGLCGVILTGITQTPNTPGTALVQGFGQDRGAILAMGYAGGDLLSGIADVIQQGMGSPNIGTQLALAAIALAAQNPGPIDIVAYSGGAQAFSTAWDYLKPEVRDRIRDVTYLSPGAFQSSPMPSGYGSTTVYASNDWRDLLVGNAVPGDARFVQTHCGHNLNCILERFGSAIQTGDPCPVGGGGVFGARPEQWIPYIDPWRALLMSLPTRPAVVTPTVKPLQNGTTSKIIWTP